jgi:hypothetical protein
MIACANRVKALLDYLPKLGCALRTSSLFLFILTISLSIGSPTVRATTPLFSCVPPEKASKFGGSLWNGFLTDGDGFNLFKVKDNKGKLVVIQFAGSIHAAPDGEPIILCYSDLVTTAFAKDYLQEKLKTLKIIDRKPRINEKGELIGERITGFLDVAVDPHKRGPNDPVATLALVIRTDGTNYSEISCRSFDDTLAFEKEIDEMKKNRGHS